MGYLAVVFFALKRGVEGVHDDPLCMKATIIVVSFRKVKFSEQANVTYVALSN
jgi:hypothetical protein